LILHDAGLTTEGSRNVIVLSSLPEKRR
jgi:hypothetical protein